MSRQKITIEARNADVFIPEIIVNARQRTMGGSTFTCGGCGWHTVGSSREIHRAASAHRCQETR